MLLIISISIHPMRLFLLIFLTIITLTTSQRTRCESFCRYRFCSNLLRDGPILQPENRIILLGLPNTPLGPIPCLVRPSGVIRFLSNITGGEATVAREFTTHPYVPISRFARMELNQPFPTDFFKWVDNDINERQTIARRAPKRNQDDVIDRACVRMPMKSFNILRSDRSVKKHVVTKGKTACVGFRTLVPILVVEFEWNTPNDFDLRLVEPNGFEINRFGLSTSPNGGTLIFDAGGTTCQIDLGREQIRYQRQRSVVEPGTYIIRVNHLRICSPRSTYELRVFYNGTVLLTERGILSELGENVLVRTFDIPS